jgi:hypothetical protein
MFIIGVFVKKKSPILLFLKDSLIDYFIFFTERPFINIVHFGDYLNSILHPRALPVHVQGSPKLSTSAHLCANTISLL